MHAKLSYCNEQCFNAYLLKHGVQPVCGCGTGHRMAPWAGQEVHYQGQHWVIDCLIEHLLKEKEERNQAMRKLYRHRQKLKKDLASLACCLCENPVGSYGQVSESFESHQGAGRVILCSTCSNDL